MDLTCGKDGHKWIVISLEKDAPWRAERTLAGVRLACRVGSPKDPPDPKAPVTDFCIVIPDALVRRLAVEVGDGPAG
jgi:hypothetical protein